MSSDKYKKDYDTYREYRVWVIHTPTGLRREFVLRGILSRKQWSKTRARAYEELTQLLSNDVRNHRPEAKKTEA